MGTTINTYQLLSSDIYYLPKSSSKSKSKIDLFFENISDHSYIISLLIKNLDTLTEPIKDESIFIETQKRTYNKFLDSMYVYHKISTRDKEKVEKFNKEFSSILKEVKLFFESIMRGEFDGAPEPEFDRGQLRGAFLEKVVREFPQKTKELLSGISTSENISETFFIEEPSFYLKKEGKIDFLISNEFGNHTSVPDYFIYQKNADIIQKDAQFFECKSKLEDIVSKSRGKRQYKYFIDLTNEIRRNIDLDIKITFLTYNSEYKVFQSRRKQCSDVCQCKRCNLNRGSNIILASDFF